MHERTRDRHALLLAAGKRIDRAAQPIAEPDLREHRRASAPRLGAAHAIQLEHQPHVLFRVERRHEIEELVDEPDVLPAKARALRLRERRYLAPVQLDAAGVSTIDAADHIEQRGFARAAAADDGDGFTVVYRALTLSSTLCSRSPSLNARDRFLRSSMEG